MTHTPISIRSSYSSPCGARLCGQAQLLQQFRLEQLEIRLNRLEIKGWSRWSSSDPPLGAKRH